MKSLKNQSSATPDLPEKANDSIHPTDATCHLCKNRTTLQC